ncbi:MAG: methyltransferase domain-containing protein [Actinomycetota bacterium]|nr:methyltransferase domain-containing protein [Actinomycetota bacterium]
MAATETAGDRLAERLFEAVLGFGDVYMVYVGDRLGLYRALGDSGPATARQVAAATGTDARYVREWLEQQAVTGILEVDDAAREAGERRYSLSSEHAEVLLDPDSPRFMTAFLRMMVGLPRALPSVLEAFRAGGGVPYADYDADFVEGQGDANRVQFVNFLGESWLPSIPDVDARLRADPPARVADIACGWGGRRSRSRAYPKTRVDGFDLDEESIRLAKENLRGTGLEDRVRFDLRDAAELDGAGYDLVTVFEAVHDLARPVDVLRSLRGLLADGGSVVVADERAAEEFSAPGDELERIFYVWSVLHCLPVGMAEQPSAGTGTLMRPETLRSYAEQAGFASVEVLPIENDFWRFYRLTP